MKNYKLNVTVNLTIAADNEDALNRLLQQMDYTFKYVDRQSEIVDTKLLETQMVAEY